MTETCPKESVDPLRGTTAPNATSQLRVFPISGAPSDVSMAVRVVELPDSKVKVDGVTVRVVVAFSIVPEETPLLDPYWPLAAKDAVTVTVVSELGAV